MIPHSSASPQTESVSPTTNSTREQQLRQELLQMILRNEEQRKATSRADSSVVAASPAPSVTGFQLHVSRVPSSRSLA